MNDEWRSLLEELVRIPSISTAHEHVQRSADAFADVLRANDCNDVQLLCGAADPAAKGRVRGFHHADFSARFTSAIRFSSRL